MLNGADWRHAVGDKRSMRIMVWGAYQQGNFGDDLMAGVFSSHLARLGHDVTVWGLASSEAASFGVSASADLEMTARSADLIVVGGGAVLKKWQVLRSVLSSEGRRLETNYLNLLRHAKRTKTPIILTSIGSDDVKTLSDLPPPRRWLLEHRLCKAASVRLERDVALLAEVDVPASYAPDILFATPCLLQSPKTAWPGPDQAIGKVLFNLHKRYAAMAERLVPLVRDLWPGVELFACNSHLEENAFDYEWRPAPGLGVTWIPYRGAIPHLAVLGEMDLVISSKLHLGLTATTLACCFLSLGGRDKVRAQLRLLDLHDLAIIPDNLETPDADLRATLAGVPEIQRRLAMLVPDLGEAAKAHLLFLEHQIKAHDGQARGI